MKIAEKLHEAYRLIEEVEEFIYDLFEEHEPEILKDLDYHISSDDYDNSIEIYFDIILPYPYEPSKEVRQGVYDLGFDMVYWNFIDENGEYTEEIRGYEPRRLKNYQHISNKHGYVDNRFNEKQWKSKYDFK